MTRQSRKPHSADLGLNQGPGKLNFSSENSHRLTQSNANTTNMSQLSTPSNQQMAPVRRSTRIFANAANTIKVYRMKNTVVSWIPNSVGSLLPVGKHKDGEVKVSPAEVSAQA